MSQEKSFFQANTHVDQLDNASFNGNQEKNKHHKLLNKVLTQKEIYDRVGYGLASHQFITILFFLTGANPFIVGLTFGIRSALTSIVGGVSKSHAKLQHLPRKKIAAAGTIYGFSLLFLILAVRIQAPYLYALSLVIGSVGVVTYGEFYSRLVQDSIKHEKKNHFLRHVTHYGLFITAIAFLFSGWLFEHVTSSSLSIGNMVVPVVGFFLSFQLAAILFFISGYFIQSLPLKKTTLPLQYLHFVKSLGYQIRVHSKELFADNKLRVLSLCAILIASAEVLGTTYYGYIIFETFKNTYFGGFMNIAVIFSAAIILSFLGPMLTRFLHRHTGLAPMFVFGTLLLAILPLTLFINQHFYAVAAAVGLTVIGSSILGVAQALLARKILSPSKRQLYFQTIEFILVLPFLILVPLGGLFVFLAGYSALYVFILSLLLLALLLYFSLVVQTNRKHI